MIREMGETLGDREHMGHMGHTGGKGDTGLTGSTVLRHEIKSKMGEIRHS